MGRLLLALMLLATPAMAADPLEVRIGLIRVQGEAELPISRLDLPPDDLGTAGATLAIEENNTTGRFMGQAYALEAKDAAPGEALAAYDALREAGIDLIVTLAPADDLAALAEKAEADGVLLLNAGATDDALRTTRCLPATLHVSPSRAILADGLAQFLMLKKWDAWFLIHGSHPEDTAWAEALRRAARKFGAKVVEARLYEDTGGARRTDTGYVQVQKQMPVFTQRAAAHDVVIAADEAGVFAEYLPYHTWDAAPVAGSAGLRPLRWHPANEAWGATQYQRRFEKMHGRRVRPEDYDAWLAVRVIGEAVTRTKSAAPADILAYATGEDFELGVFKGTKVTFRPWNRQLRQPVLLAHDRVIVSVSPQAPYLHHTSQLDTLGFDAPESQCDFD